MKAEAGRTDPGCEVGLEKVPAPETVMAAPDARRVVSFLYASLHGPLAPSPGAAAEPGRPGPSEIALF